VLVGVACEGSATSIHRLRDARFVDLADVCSAGAADQVRLLAQGEVSARELVDATLRRIDELDPVLNAYRIVLAEQALARAGELDDLPRGARGVLHGVPVAVKDDTDVAGTTTTFGTAAHGPPQAVDAVVVARLRAAGAVIVGKTCVPEMDAWPWTSSVTFGTTRNPWELTRTPGGSSGGSAAATASGMCGVALGSDGGGSVRYPAALCGLFGLKPQRGRIPLDVTSSGAGWHGLVAYGPLARHVADAAVFLDATGDGAPPGGFGRALSDPVPALRVAVSFDPPPGSLVRLSSERRAAVERTAALLTSFGHHVFQRELRDGRRTMADMTVRYLAGVSHDVGELPHRDRLEPRTRRLARLGQLIPARAVLAARRHAVRTAVMINEIFDHADVVLTPIAADAPPLLGELPADGLLRSLRASNHGAWAMPWNVIGQPAATVPVGLDRAGLPLAVQLCGRPNDEVTLLRLAHQIEAGRPTATTSPTALADR
jgi:amidase